MKFWGLFCQTAHKTQQIVQCHQYLSPYMISPNQNFTTHAPDTYICVTRLTFLWKNLQAYNIEGTVQQE